MCERANWPEQGMSQIDLIRCLGAHHVLAPFDEDANAEKARTKPGSVTLFQDVTGQALPIREYTLSRLESLLLSAETESVSFETGSLLANSVSATVSARLKTAKDSLSTAIKTDTGSDPLFQMHAAILTARVALVSGLPSDAVSILSDWVLHLDAQGRRKIDALADSSSPYHHVLYLMAACVLGQSYLAVKEWTSASSCFELASDLITKKPRIPPSVSNIMNLELRKSVQEAASAVGVLDQWIAWTEEVFYGLVGLAMEQKNQDSLLQLSKKYNLQFAQLPVYFRPSKRATVLRTYLATAAANTPSSPPTSESVGPINAKVVHPFNNVFSPFTGLPRSQVIYPPRISATVLAEFQTLLPLYESLVVHACPFPRLAGGDDPAQDRIMALRHRAVVECFEWLGITEVCLDGTGGTWEAVERAYRIVETMYRATKHTFQNLNILRHLCHAFASLLGHLCDSASDAEVSEALLAFRAYEELYTRRQKEATADAIKLGVAFDGVVDGERVADVVGVLVGGVRVCLAWFRSDDDLLETAREFMDFALHIVDKYQSGIDPTDLKSLYEEIYRFRGIVYGELGSEVSSSDNRHELQETAISSLRESIRLRENPVSDWQLHYQCALQLGEMGEVTTAITVLQESLQINSKSVSSWHLLALLLSSCRQYVQAIEVCEAGWREALEGASIKSASIAEGFADEGETTAIIIWDSVPVKVKEELFNIKLTQLLLISKLNGPKAALDALQPLFSLFSRMFNPLLRSLEPNVSSSPTAAAVTPSAYSYASSEASFTKNEIPSRMPSATPTPPTLEVPHSRMATDGSTLARDSESFCPPYFGYSFRVFDLQVCLWMTAAALYTQMDCFVDAGLALVEAEGIAKSWVALDQKVHTRESLLFKGIAIGKGSYTFMKEAQIPLPTKKVATLKKGTGRTTLRAQDEPDLLKRWSLADLSLRRVLADVCFGNAMLKFAKYHSTNAVKTVPLFSKYKPTIQSGLDLPGSSDRLSRRPSLISTFSVNQNGGSTLSLHSIRAKATSVRGSSQSITVPAGNSLTVDSVEKAAGIARSSSPASGISQAASTKPSAIREEPTATLDAIIADLHMCLALDNEHVPSRVELAKCYKVKSEEYYAESEFWFEQACKFSKLRGSGSGSRGLSTYFGGLTGPYGAACWEGLGQVLKRTAVSGTYVNESRLEVAKNCLFYAVQTDRTVSVRGLQVLGRLSE
ncbi:hypothetical protein BC830DRAFT_1121946 [Chytriomyces sp. MP71]|nr:hypothetical protein BC830DRAFT_1121946 [Chytriomyces sp. MP71]